MNPTAASDALLDSLRATMGKMELALDSIGESIVWTDAAGRIEWANATFSWLIDRPRIMVLGRNLAELLPLELDGKPVARSEHPAFLALIDEPAVTRTYEWRAPNRRTILEVSPSRFQLGANTISVVFVIRDVTEGRLAQEAVLQAEEEASQANKAKSEFLSRMSHELRTPLNAVLGFAQLLELEDLDEWQRESTNQILEAGSHLLALINDLLDVSRIEEGRLSLSPEPVALREAIEEALDLVEALAGKHGIALRATEIPAGRYVEADRQRMKQVLLNLLSNGIKYNRARGAVTVSVEDRADGRVRILVSDTGPGISPERQSRAFAPFDRLDAEYTGVEGTGLGLALSKALIEAMGGSMGVDSVEGEGSTFWFEVAVADGPIERDEGHNRAAAPAAASSPDRHRTILYVEDNLSIVKLIESALAYRPGVRLMPSMQARMGLELAREHRPDLILLDLHLPDMSGAEALMRLRADPTTRDIPVVILSADASPHQIERLVREGARAYLTKPLDVRKFLGLIDELLVDESGGEGAGEADPPTAE